MAGAGPNLTVQIGEASFPSGICILVDFGMLHLWRGAHPPESAGDNLLDLQLTGPSAAAAGKALGRQWHPLFLYDVSRLELPEIQRNLGALAVAGFQAGAAPLHQRVPHRLRVDAALKHGLGAGPVPFGGTSAIAIADIAPGARCPVVATQMGLGDSRWHSVSLEVLPGVAHDRHEKIGPVKCETGRLLYADVDALSGWNPDLSLGWQSAHFHVIEQIRTNPTLEAGIVDLGPARMAGFMTKWPPGEHMVYRDFDPTGRLVRVSVVFDEPVRMGSLSDM